VIANRALRGPKSEATHWRRHMRYWSFAQGSGGERRTGLDSASTRDHHATSCFASSHPAATNRRNNQQVRRTVIYQSNNPRHDSVILYKAIWGIVVVWVAGAVLDSPALPVRHCYHPCPSVGLSTQACSGEFRVLRSFKMTCFRPEWGVQRLVNYLSDHLSLPSRHIVPERIFRVISRCKQDPTLSARGSRRQ